MFLVLSSLQKYKNVNPLGVAMKKTILKNFNFFKNYCYKKLFE